MDLTMAVGPDTAVFPGYPKPAVLQWSKIDVHGYFSNVLFMPEHVATHVDSPAHFVAGAATIDKIEPSTGGLWRWTSATSRRVGPWGLGSSRRRFPGAWSWGRGGWC